MSSISTVDDSARPSWSRVAVGSTAVAAADRDALGTTARLVVWPPASLARLVAVVDRVLARLDAQASRFRQDSEISQLHRAGAGRYLISDGLAEAVAVALAAAQWTGGRCDPTVGQALISLGYDRDFAAIARDDAAPDRDRAAADGTRPRDITVPGWRLVRLEGNALDLPATIRLDLGATAKGLGADRAARAAHAAARGGGVLVSLGGDVAVAGIPPAGGWPLLVADEHQQVRAERDLVVQAARVRRSRRQGRPAPADPATAQLIRLPGGGLATSSVTCRQWRSAGELRHHIIDPGTGRPAAGPWRTVSVAAASCAEANAASTSAIVAGVQAPQWLADQGLPARLVGHDGSVVRTGGWPEADGGRVEPPSESRMLAGTDLRRRTS